MSDYEKILVTSHQNTNESKESLVGAYRGESPFDHTTGSRIRTKIPPLFDGSTSWFKYEELIEDWLDLTVLEKTKRRPALKTRLVGDAEMHKRLLDRKSLRATDGVKYFRNTLRHHFIQGAHNVFLWRFCQFNRARRGILEMVKWIGRFSLSLQRLKDARKDNLQMSTLSEEQRRIQYLADVAQEKAERLTKEETVLDPNTPQNRERWNTAQVSNHEGLFPYGGNWITLMFIVASDLAEAQRERLTSSLSLKGLNITGYTFAAVKTTLLELSCTPKSSMENTALRVSGHVSSMNRTFIPADPMVGYWCRVGSLAMTHTHNDVAILVQWRTLLRQHDGHALPGATLRTRTLLWPTQTRL